MEEKDWIRQEDDPTYRTGSTDPLQNRRGWLVCLLIPVILLSGFMGLLTGLRIRLFQWGENVPAPVQFSKQDAQAALPTLDGDEESLPTKEFSLGFTGEDVSGLWQSYYGLPEGVFVTQVVESDTGLCRGDILLFLNGQRITGIDSLTAILKGCEPTEALKFVIYRGGVRQVLTFGG